jgi:hypothetical protein
MRTVNEDGLTSWTCSDDDDIVLILFDGGLVIRIVVDICGARSRCFVSLAMEGIDRIEPTGGSV